MHKQESCVALLVCGAHVAAPCPGAVIWLYLAVLGDLDPLVCLAKLACKFYTGMQLFTNIVKLSPRDEKSHRISPG